MKTQQLRRDFKPLLLDKTTQCRAAHLREDRKQWPRIPAKPLIIILTFACSSGLTQYICASLFPIRKARTLDCHVHRDSFDTHFHQPVWILERQQIDSCSLGCSNTTMYLLSNITLPRMAVSSFQILLRTWSSLARMKVFFLYSRWHLLGGSCVCRNWQCFRPEDSVFPCLCYLSDIMRLTFAVAAPCGDALPNALNIKTQLVERSNLKSPPFFIYTYNSIIVSKGIWNGCFVFIIISLWVSLLRFETCGFKRMPRFDAVHTSHQRKCCLVCRCSVIIIVHCLQSQMIMLFYKLGIYYYMESWRRSYSSRGEVEVANAGAFEDSTCGMMMKSLIGTMQLTALHCVPNIDPYFR